jgi:hypothetical protein
VRGALPFCFLLVKKGFFMHEVSIVSTDDTSAYSAQLDESLFCKTQDFTNQTMYDCQLIPFESKTIHDLLSEKTSFLNFSSLLYSSEVMVPSANAQIPDSADT